MFWSRARTASGDLVQPACHLFAPCLSPSLNSLATLEIINKNYCATLKPTSPLVRYPAKARGILQGP